MKLRQYPLDTALREASAFKEELITGRAKDEAQAEKIVAKGTLETAGFAMALVGAAAGYSDDVISAITRGSWRHEEIPNKDQIAHSIVALDPDTAMEVAGRFFASFMTTIGRTDQADTQYKEYADFWMGLILERHLNPNNIDQFIDLGLWQFAKPSEVFEKMKKMGAQEDVIKKLLQTYEENNIDLKNLELFGSEGYLKSLSEPEKKAVLQKYVAMLMGNLDLKFRDLGCHIDPFDIQTPLLLLAGAAEEGIFLDDVDQLIDQLKTCLSYVPDNYSGRWLGELDDKLGQLEALSKMRDGKMPEEIKGTGLEISHDQTIFFDGKLVGRFPDAIFSQRPTDGRIVAWLKKFQIDKDFTGPQFQASIFVWKPGFERPQVAYEEHAWTRERALTLEAPEVTADGKIIIRGTTNGVNELSF